VFSVVIFLFGSGSARLGDTRAVEVLEPLVKSDCEKKNSWKKTVSECASRAIEKLKQQREGELSSV